MSPILSNPAIANPALLSRRNGVKANMSRGNGVQAQARRRWKRSKEETKANRFPCLSAIQWLPFWAEDHPPFGFLSKLTEQFLTAKEVAVFAQERF